METTEFQEGVAFEAPPVEASPDAFVVDVDGFAGPLDVLLTLAREQKVDLARISILQLADQYLAFVMEARQRNLELAADYLVMAAWLAYLKSRLLLPPSGSEEEPSGEEMAAALAFQLRRLEAMQEAGQRLMTRPRLGHDFFARGMPERFAAIETVVYDLSLYELLKSYGDQQKRRMGGVLHIEPFEIFTVEEALVRLKRMLGMSAEWESLWRFLPENVKGGLKWRSALASTFTASLELAKQGQIRLRQAQPFGPIFLRAESAPPAISATPEPTAS